MYAALSYTGSVASRGLPYEWQSLVDIYVLAESLVDIWAKNRIIDAMHSFMVQHLFKMTWTGEDVRAFGQSFSVAALVSLYNGTPITSKARKLVADLFADSVSVSWVEANSLLLPQEFLVDLTVRLLQKRSYGVFDNKTSRPSSHYYEKLKDDELTRKDRLPDKSLAPVLKPEARECLPLTKERSSTPEVIPHCNFSFTVTEVRATQGS
ncbi:hypothetical protein E8E11_004844 [Didymella keratinophila]|nr:hypothetical protein E8E11_004844 [Didymella keratinophila]